MLIQADARKIPLADGSVQCVVTSPPYWGLRDYGTARWSGGVVECDHTPKPNQGQTGQRADRTFTGTPPFRESCGRCGALRIDSQLGLESTPEEYVSNMVAVFREVWRVLRPDGTIWVNLGDSYGKNQGKGFDTNRDGGARKAAAVLRQRTKTGLKPKDLVGIPWRVAFALQADGWYLRSDIIWAKPNPMPESVTDRPTKAHEYVFLLAKSKRYFYDGDAIKESCSDNSHGSSNINPGWKQTILGANQTGSLGKWTAEDMIHGRNCRSVWTISTQPYSGAHFATFPEKLVEPCILAGSRPGDIVFDPFVGSGTVIRVAKRHQRKGVGCDISYSYLYIQAKNRIRKVQVKMFF